MNKSPEHRPGPARSVLEADLVLVERDLQQLDLLIQSLTAQRNILADELAQKQMDQHIQSCVTEQHKLLSRRSDITEQLKQWG